MAKKKYYVVWNGILPGIYDTWDECKKQVNGFDKAMYKSFSTKEEADKAFASGPYSFISNDKKKVFASYRDNPDVIQDSLAVDAASSGNPGLMEYRGVYLRSGEQVFHQGVYEEGTNNVGEFLAIVHGLALLKQKQSLIPVYSDSTIAIKWVREKKCKTKLVRTPVNESLFYLIERAEIWLRENTYKNEIIKWKTSEWGEIPADFGRK